MTAVNEAVYRAEVCAHIDHALHATRRAITGYVSQRSHDEAIQPVYAALDGALEALVAADRAANQALSAVLT